MLTSHLKSWFKLALFMLVSTVALTITAQKISAHEVLPTISDLFVDRDGTVVWDLQINVEAFLAEIDLDAVSDTDEDAAGADYDALRRLPATDLAPRVASVVDGFNASASLQAVTASGQTVPLLLEDANVSIPDDTDFELPRISKLTLQAQPPEQIEAILVNWPDGSGALVVRQQGVDAPYTGYLQGGEISPPIVFSSGASQAATDTLMTYIPVGFGQVLPRGTEFVLFALGMFFFSRNTAPVLSQAGAFAVGHSLTLVVATMGWMSVPYTVLGPILAASLVYLGLGNLFMRQTIRWRLIVIFAFGLAFGFAASINAPDPGLTQSDGLHPALLGIWLGLEIGILTIIALAFLILNATCFQVRSSTSAPSHEVIGQYDTVFLITSTVGSILIALMGFYLFVERVLI